MAFNISTSPMEARNSLRFRKFAFISKRKSNSFPRTSREDAYFASINSEAAAYTSLKDLMPSRRRSKTCHSESSFVVQSVDDIPMSNLLVQKAAWAYLQPMPNLLAASSSWCHEPFLSRVWDGLMPPMKACVNFFNKYVLVKIRRAFNRVMGAIHITQV